MKKVFQTVVDRGKGNCMQAALASLFDLELEQVPNFADYGLTDGKWFHPFWDFILSQGYEYSGTLYNVKDSLVRGNIEWYEKVKDTDRFSELKDLDGINGLFYAAVYSPKFFDANDKTPATHAVLIDKEFNIVHDPNPAYQNIESYPKSDVLGYNGIIDIYVIDKKK
jgi:hypothetical protein